MRPQCEGGAFAVRHEADSVLRTSLSLPEKGFFSPHMHIPSGDLLKAEQPFSDGLITFASTLPYAAFFKNLSRVLRQIEQQMKACGESFHMHARSQPNSSQVLSNCLLECSTFWQKGVNLSLWQILVCNSTVNNLATKTSLAMVLDAYESYTQAFKVRTVFLDLSNTCCFERDCFVALKI